MIGPLEGQTWPADGVEGWRLEGAGRGKPLVIRFGALQGSGDGADLGGLARAIVGPGVPEHGTIRLEDHARAGYYRGVVGLGETIEATVEALRSLIEGIEPGRLITLGAGIGGHAALVYGILLGAGRIVAIQPAAHLIGEVLDLYSDSRWRRSLAEMPEPAEARRHDVRALLGRGSYSGRAYILLGTRNVKPDGDRVHLDVIHAHWLAGSDRVTLHPFPEARDLTAGGSAGAHGAAGLLARLLFDDERPDAPPPRAAAATIEARPGGSKLVYDPKLTICTIDAKDPRNKTGRDISYGAAGDVDPLATRRMTDDLRGWIVENLLLDSAPADLADKLLPLGISRGEAFMEIDLARFHPYFLGSKRAQARSRKRDWLLATYRKLDRSRRGPDQVERRESISRGAFLERYRSTGRPLILARIMAGWPAPESRERDDLARRFGAPQSGPEAADRWTLVAEETAGGRDFLAELAGDAAALAGPLLDREPSSGTLWLGPAGATAPPIEGRAGLLVLPLAGRVRASVVLLWDTPLLPGGPDWPSIPGPTPAGPGTGSPLDRPKIMACTVEPGELLFLPAGCASDLKGADPTLTLTFGLSG